MAGVHRAWCVASAVLTASLLWCVAGEKGLAQLKGLAAPAYTEQAWTLDDAMDQLTLHPRDPYLQYVVLQLAQRQGRLDHVAHRVERLARRRGRNWDRRSRVDLFSIFTGALAVHESLQLDTMTGREGPRRKVFEKEPDRFDKEAPTKETPPPPNPPKKIEGPPAEKPSAKQQPAARNANRIQRRANVRLADLTGPTIKSHPFKEMLGGKKPKISPLALMVPDDHYFVQCRTLTKLLELVEVGDLWASHWFKQAQQDASSSDVGQRLRRQLAVRTNPLARPFYDLVVEQVALTGSDLFIREGSDVALLFLLKQPEVFRGQMDRYLAAAAESSDAKRSSGKYLGVSYDHVSTPGRQVHVFSAYPRKDLHVRCNSVVALQRVISAIKNDNYRGKVQQRLGETDEFKYIRTLMPEGAEEEDVFVYLSDPFVRHIVGPKLKLTQRRRMLAYNHLRMIGHAALLQQTQFGRRAKSLKELAENGLAPGVFGEGKLKNPLEGEYALASDGLSGHCSVAGSPLYMTPNCEIEIEEVTPEEADEYRAFLREYSSYWRTFFDPIAIRLRMTEKQYRAETIVLPLIDNSIYTGLAEALGGKVEPLDALPVPGGNIFSMALRFNKEEILRSMGAEELIENKQAKVKRQWDETTDVAASRLRQMGLALHNYHDVYNRFPPAAVHDRAAKKPLLSWRVHVLPFLEDGGLQLYNRFRLDEPWDSEHNKKLIAELPRVFRPSNRKLAAEGKTTFVAPLGKGTIFPAGATRGVTLGQVIDGSSNTIMLVEADDEQAVIWTRPDDLPYDPKKPLAGLRVRQPGAFLALMGDGSVQLLRTAINEQTLQRLFTRNDNQVVAVQPGDRVALRQDRRRADWRWELRREFNLPPDYPLPDVPRFLARGVGNQIGFHVYDSQQFFDFNFSGFLGQAMGSGGGLADDWMLPVSVLVAALNSPVYVSVPVNDAEVVDRFLDELDPLLARLARMKVESWFWDDLFDFYRLETTKAGTKTRAFGFQFGPIKWRFFWARVGDGLYIASKKFILDDLEQAAARQAKLAASAEKRDAGPSGHAMVRVRPQNWNKVLPDFQLAWAENNRRAVLNNLGPLTSVARAYAAANGKMVRENPAKAASAIVSLAEQIYGVKFLSPDGGKYQLAKDGASMVHSLYGSQLAPKQPPELSKTGHSARLLRQFAGATAELKFLDDGLHAVLTIERRER